MAFRSVLEALWNSRFTPIVAPWKHRKLLFSKDLAILLNAYLSAAYDGIEARERVSPFSQSRQLDVAGRWLS
jgi:hypothetical protein